MSSRVKPYLCKHCGESDIEKFYEKRYTTCKKCRNLQSTECHIKKDIGEKATSFLCDKELEKNIEQYFCSYHRIFGNRSVVDILRENEQEIQRLKDENESHLNKISILINEQTKISTENSNLFKELRELGNENLEIKNKLNQILKVLNLKI